MSVNDGEFMVCIRFKVEKFSSERASDGGPWCIHVVVVVDVDVDVDVDVVVCKSVVWVVVERCVVDEPVRDVGGSLNNSENDL